MFVKLAMKYNKPNALNEVFLARLKHIDRKDCLALTKLYIQVFNPAKAAGAEKYLSQHKVRSISQRAVSTFRNLTLGTSTSALSIHRGRKLKCSRSFRRNGARSIHWK